MGGDGQAQTHVQFLSRVIDDDRDIQDAIDRPRWRVSLTDWSVWAESPFDDAVTEGLTARGHHVEVVDPGHQFGHAHAIRVTEDGYAAAFDPRSEGGALGL
jgi:gamma-glutamyltranspeptidase/glutathione hydrolase